ncbi:MAG: glycosyl hydrolase family 28-related protein [Mariniphaga sp.]
MKHIGRQTILIVLLIVTNWAFVFQAQGHGPADSSKPVILNASEGALPGEAFGIQGAFFGPDAEIWYAAVKGNEKNLVPTASLNVLSHSDSYVAAVLPDEKIVPAGQLTAVWIKNGQQLSEPVYLNRARAITVEFEEIMPGHLFRIFGRNLHFAGQQPTVLFYDNDKNQSLQADVLQSDRSILEVKAPLGLIPGRRYSLKVNNGAGGKWGESTAEETILAREIAPDPFAIGAPWGANFKFNKNSYNLKTDSRLKVKAKGDSVTNDRNAIQQAIDMASANGGGVVYFPEGNYRLEFATGCGLTMRSNVVLKGDGPGRTVIQYGYGTPPPYPDPIGKGGWPDEIVEGVGLLWPLGTTRSGLSELCLRNVNTSGLWRHSLKTMRPKDKKPGASGSEFFAVNCHFDLSVAWGLSWSYVDRMVIANCDFKSITQNTWPWLLHCNGSTNFAVRNNRIHYSAGRFGFNDSFNGIIENNHITRLGNLQTLKGETGGFNIDYAKDIVVLKNHLDVDGTPIADKNQGETILSQGGNPVGQTMGKVTGATKNSLSDSKQQWQKFGTNETIQKSTINTSDLSISNCVAIISGKGTGQWRYITGNDATSLQIDRPWDVIPEEGSQYDIMKWSAEDWLVKDNVLEGNNRGIWFYCGGQDVMIEGNRLIDSDGIYLRADQRMEVGRFNLIWNVSVENNRVTRTDSKRPAYICSVLAIQKTHSLLGTGTLGVEMRRNYIQTKKPNSGSFVTGEGYWNEIRSSTPEALKTTVGILGTIFEKNTAVNTDFGYRLSKAISQTVIKDPIYVDVTSPTNESLISESSKIGTVIVSDVDKPVVNNDPFLPYLNGQAPKIVKDLGEETANGVRIRKVVFHSYDYKNKSKDAEAVIFGAIVRPEKAGNYPGLLLLHGGGGYAEIEKAKKWAILGYVVVVVDEPGVANPDKIPFSHGPWEGIKYGENRFITTPTVTSSTIFSSVLASLQGLYLLNAQSDVIKDKIGVLGISWGGYLTTIVSGLANPMIHAAFSVYGCGFYDDGSTFLRNLNTMKPEERATWLKYLDAGRRADAIKVPFFIASGTNDNWFYPPAVMSTLKIIKGPVNHVFSQNTSHKIDLPGGTNAPTPGQPGWLSMEQIYFDYYLKGEGKPLPKIQEITAEKSANGNTKVRFKVNSLLPVAAGQVCYSLVGVEWTKRKWETVQATAAEQGWYEADIPSKDLKNAFECFATVSDARPVSVSSYLVWCN